MSALSHTHVRPAKPVVLYDGDCGFCCYWVRRWVMRCGDRVAFLPYQDCAHIFTDIPVSLCEQTVVLVEQGGCVCTHSDAVARVLDYGGQGLLLKLHERMGIARKLTRGVYAFIARNRSWLSRWFFTPCEKIKKDDAYDAINRDV